MMMMFKRVNGKLMMIERHFYVFFFIAIAVGMTITIAIVEADARSEEEPECYSAACKRAQTEADPETEPSSEYEAQQQHRETKMDAINDEMKRVIQQKEDANKAVSYTHLTLPTNREV